MRAPRLLACVAVAAGVSVAAGAQAAPTRTAQSDPYPGVHHETWVDAAIPARIHLVRVDLSAQELTLFATAEADRGQRTSQWASGAGVQVAINGDAFAIAGYVPTGLALGGGAAWSTSSDDASSGFLRFARVGERTVAAIVAPEQVVAASELPGGTQGVVSGRPLLVRAGQPVAGFDCADQLAIPCVRAPRTALALSADGTTLWLAVVDGWQAASLGLTCAELAGFLDARGAHDALALDGGGAATLVITGEGGVVSAPSDGVQRTVANHLGIRYGMLDPGQLVGFIREGDVFEGPDLAGVRVTLDDGRVDTTGVDGFYNFAGVTPRLACVVAEKAGYRTETRCKQVLPSMINYNSIAMYPGVDPRRRPARRHADRRGAGARCGRRRRRRRGRRSRWRRRRRRRLHDRAPRQQRSAVAVARARARAGVAVQAQKRMTVRTQVHTALYTGAEGHLLERTFRLRVVAGPDAGIEHALDEGTTMVGTHGDNTVVLTDSTVSRYHLELRVRTDGILVKDLDTTNGTRHGGTKLGQVVLTGPARLRLGKQTEVELVPDEREVSLDDYQGDRFGRVIGTSPAMLRLFALLARISPTEATVMLSGETGTGKEAMAEAIHQRSGRAAGPFVVVDCGSIPHELIASELFGHARGSYTGATSDKRGLIEVASGGTLFLDEIGELALDLQPQLLRVLDKRQVRRVGETAPVDVDIRVVAATHRDLRAMVKAGQFREDLYYRLAVVRCEIPPLRERLADVAALARHFAEEMGRSGFDLSAALIEQLGRHDWPGNVRELRNVVERALSLGTSQLELSDDTGAARAPVVTGLAPPPTEVLELPFKEAKAALIEGFEREYLVHLLARNKGNISRAAAEAGIDRNYIHRLVKKYNIDVDRG